VITVARASDTSPDQPPTRTLADGRSWMPCATMAGLCCSAAIVGDGWSAGAYLAVTEGEVICATSSHGC